MGRYVAPARFNPLTRLWTSWPHDGGVKGDSWLHAGADFALGALELKNTRILVNCLHGVSRAPSMTYTLLLCLGFSSADVETRIPTARSCAVLPIAMTQNAPHRRGVGGCGRFRTFLEPNFSRFARIHTPVVCFEQTVMSRRARRSRKERRACGTSFRRPLCGLYFSC